MEQILGELSKHAARFAKGLRRQSLSEKPGIKPPETLTQEMPILVSESGQPILEPPTGADLARLTGESPKVAYYPFQIPQEDMVPGSTEARAILSMDDEWGYSIVNNFTIGGNAFNDFVAKPLARSIADYMTQEGLEQVGVRGIACSVGEGDVQVPWYDQKIEVMDAQKILSGGIESDKDSTNINVFDGKDEIGHRTVQWIVQHPQRFRQAMGDNPEGAKIFPMLLVYDLQNLEPHIHYGVKLKPGENWSDALLKAYILPYPHKYALEESAQ